LPVARAAADLLTGIRPFGRDPADTGAFFRFGWFRRAFAGFFLLALPIEGAGAVLCLGSLDRDCLHPVLRILAL